MRRAGLRIFLQITPAVPIDATGAPPTLLDAGFRFPREGAEAVTTSQWAVRWSPRPRRSFTFRIRCFWECHRYTKQ